MIKKIVVAGAVAAGVLAAGSVLPAQAGTVTVAQPKPGKPRTGKPGTGRPGAGRPGTGRPGAAGKPGAGHTTPQACRAHREGTGWACVTPEERCPASAHGQLGSPATGKQQYRCIKYSDGKWRWYKA
jgi:hypothetical protein